MSCMILTSIMQAMHGLTGRGAELVLPKQWEPGVSYLVAREAATKPIVHEKREDLASRTWLLSLLLKLLLRIYRLWVSAFTYLGTRSSREGRCVVILR